MRRFAAFALGLTLAACGVDGAPIKPNDEAPTASEASLSGTAEVGALGDS